VEKYGTAGQATHGNITRRMRFTCCITKARLRTHTRDVKSLLLFHTNNSYANVPPCYVTHFLSCLYQSLSFSAEVINDWCFASTPQLPSWRALVHLLPWRYTYSSVHS